MTSLGSRVKTKKTKAADSLYNRGHTLLFPLHLYQFIILFLKPKDDST